MREETDRADSGWDDYAERVLRNESRLAGLEVLAAKTREADQQLIAQRSESLARELERRADALLELVTARADAILTLGHEEREADRREVLALTAEADRRGQLAQTLLREVYDAAIVNSHEQSHTEIKGVREIHDLHISKLTLRLEHEMTLAREKVSSDIAHIDERSKVALDQLEKMVRQWRDSDREARELFAAELARHLDVLNHNNERMSAFQANSVTRELWQSEKDAAINREGLLRDQIITLDRTMLTMTPIAQADKTHAETLTRMEATVTAATQVLDNKIGVVADKVEELKSYRDTTSGRSAGYSALYAWVATAVAIIVSVIVIANFLTTP